MSVSVRLQQSWRSRVNSFCIERNVFIENADFATREIISIAMQWTYEELVNEKKFVVSLQVDFVRLLSILSAYNI